jgi:hypothetical protein
MLARLMLGLIALVLLGTLLGAVHRAPPTSAYEPLPTPVGQLGGREPLPTAVGMPTPPSSVPPPASGDHRLVGAWSLVVPEAAPARLVLSADGLAGFVDGAGHRGAGVWVPRGSQRGDVVVAVRSAGLSAESPITLLQGTILLGPGPDAVTLEYRTAPVAGPGTPAAPTGPFHATGRRVGAG